ncbi:MAG TPA: helix-turn-helix transcriptional regulator [Bryobacteraceae bacterium]|nr:helix-turn-helix transcriptional regulator [Bryobacteraceae bacterium]
MSISRQEDRGVEIRSFGVTFRNQQNAGYLVPPQPKGWQQLIYATRGVMTVRTDDCAWVVPPHRGVWIPAGIRYRVEMSGVVALRMLYLHSPRRGRQLFPNASRTCSVVNVTPLLRELIVRTVLLGALNSTIPEQKRLIGVIRDELKVLVAVPLQLPMPRDARATRFATLVETDPGSATPVETLLRKCGASRRTMERLFRAETAMSLGQWLRRQKLLRALRRLADGDTVQTVALELGYNSASAFIVMFQKELGQTPRRYFEN